MRIGITGASGLVGTALRRSLEADGHRVAPFVRRPPAEGEIFWDPARGDLDASELEGLDAVVHLAGESVAGGRWTEERKRRIRDSRVHGTDLLARALAACARRPRVLVSASAVGFYGDRGDEVLDEEAGPGEGFLAEVCQAWEAAAEPARQAGVRVAHPRIGVVLAAEGGALAKMKGPFRLGLGGVIGTGQQFMSWVHRDDLVAMLRFAVDTEALEGPFNAVAPQPVRNAEFTKALGAALGRPTMLPLPAFAARLAMGRELADEMLLASTRCVPARLQSLGFTFRYPQLEAALRSVL